MKSRNILRQNKREEKKKVEYEADNVDGTLRIIIRFFYTISISRVNHAAITCYTIKSDPDSNSTRIESDPDSNSTRLDSNRNERVIKSLTRLVRSPTNGTNIIVPFF